MLEAIDAMDGGVFIALMLGITWVINLICTVISADN
jgi:hypothetical protein